jgi:hypothetical protein
VRQTDVDSSSQAIGFTRDEVEDEARLSEQKACYRKHIKVKVKNASLSGGSKQR